MPRGTRSISAAKPSTSRCRAWHQAERQSWDHCLGSVALVCTPASCTWTPAHGEHGKDSRAHVSALAVPRRCAWRLPGGADFKQPGRPSERDASWRYCGERGWNALLPRKGVTCAAGTVIAAPLAGIAALSESPFAPEIQQELGDGVAHNCGPPYALSPYRKVSIKPTAEVPEPPASGPPPATPSAGPAPPRPLDRARDIPLTSMPARTTDPPREHSAAPLTKEIPEPAVDGPIKLFNK